VKTINYIFIASVIINLVLGWWIYDITKEDQKPNEELLKSQGRVEILEERQTTLQNEYLKLKKISDSLSIEISNKPKERIVIKKIYNEKIIHVTSLSVDSSVKYLSGRLSEIDYN
tara:strand:- start:8848 stop:9192 length:345 start_codon:yes stop_codon:yes gene_type:complete